MRDVWSYGASLLYIFKGRTRSCGRIAGAPVLSVSTRWAETSTELWLRLCKKLGERTRSQSKSRGCHRAFDHPPCLRGYKFIYPKCSHPILSYLPEVERAQLLKWTIATYGYNVTSGQQLIYTGTICKNFYTWRMYSGDSCQKLKASKRWRRLPYSAIDVPYKRTVSTRWVFHQTVSAKETINFCIFWIDSICLAFVT